MYDTNVRNTATFDDDEGETASHFERDLNDVFFDKNVEAFDVVIGHEKTRCEEATSHRAYTKSI
ncbi:hypothetical protein HCJ39_07205 [Listeria rocourtiae]|uniref:hypothetical protein n=1 Tax=Listeria rocourtiae TaxID=647910 RepID=UPI00162A17D7|nr:hypothetical protein [Listeria rocourtiae]MBC1604498.1 hypothetical protein [Listeria rocourtiae]